MKTKFLSVALLLSLSVALGACTGGGETEMETAPEGETMEEPATEETMEEPAAEETEAPEGEATEGEATEGEAE